MAAHDCAYCGAVGKCDPAHVWPRGMVACAEPECVIPLCRRCHNLYDTGKLNLLPVLQLPMWRRQYEHAVAHAGTEDRALWKITNTRP